MGLTLMMAEAAAKQSPCPVPESVKNGSILKEMSTALTSIQLYGSSVIAAEVHKFVQHIFNNLQYQKPSLQEIATLDMELQKLTSEMKADLSQQDISKRGH
jgi:hypothetical protein